MKSRREAGRRGGGAIGARGASAVAVGILACVLGCGDAAEETIDLEVPRGYVSTLEIPLGGRILSFGPFVGYYFRPDDPSDLTRLRFVCFNERSFYTLDLPRNVKLFVGEAVLAELPEPRPPVPSRDRIHPVFFEDAPASWLDTRPEPRDEFVHFHSCHDAAGPTAWGYWLRHEGVAEFTYDMGGRVEPGSPLHHRVMTGPDRGFARIVEFDRGP